MNFTATATKPAGTKGREIVLEVDGTEVYRRGSKAGVAVVVGDVDWSRVHGDRDTFTATHSILRVSKTKAAAVKAAAGTLSDFGDAAYNLRALEVAEPAAAQDDAVMLPAGGTLNYRRLVRR